MLGLSIIWVGSLECCLANVLCLGFRFKPNGYSTAFSWHQPVYFQAQHVFCSYVLRSCKPVGSGSAGIPAAHTPSLFQAAAKLQYMQPQISFLPTGIYVLYVCNSQKVCRSLREPKIRTRWIAKFLLAPIDRNALMLKVLNNLLDMLQSNFLRVAYSSKTLKLQLNLCILDKLALTASSRSCASVLISFCV